jgi:squamous cell carcinoma antigen recognized by T-cells 3
VDRAIRNCTWSHELYIEKMHVLEARGEPKEEIQKILELATVLGFQTAEPLVAVWLEYLTYLKRHTTLTDETQMDVLRKNFDMAWSSLGRMWGVLADCSCEILQFWGRLEYGEGGALAKGRELWTTVLESSDNGTKSGLWVEFANLELRKGHEAARR